MSGDEPGRTYYDVPALKEPVWIWTVPVYFHVGGVAGVAAVIGAAAQLLGGREMRPLVARSRTVAAAGTAAGSVLLIADLGRPERFLNMLRVFRPTSPLSVGSWVLAAAASLSGVAAVLANARQPARALGDAAGLAAGAAGVPLAGYTAVLLATTAVPVWRSAATSLPLLFVASATTSGAATLGAMELGPRPARALELLGRSAALVETVAMSAVELETGRNERVGKALRRGRAGSLWKAAKVLSSVGLALSFLPNRRPRQRSLELLVATAGGLCLRFGLFHAGKASTRDPRAAFER